MERRRLKIRKIKYDIKFLLTCKRNQLIPTFAKPRIAIKTDLKTKKRIAKVITEAEIKNQHKRFNNFQKAVKYDLTKLRSTLGFITYCSLNKTINKRIEGKLAEWKKNYDNKLQKLFKEVSPKTSTRPENIVHNFFSHELSAEENTYFRLDLTTIFQRRYTVTPSKLNSFRFSIILINNSSIFPKKKKMK